MWIGAGFVGFSAGSAQDFGDNRRISRGTAPLFTPEDGAFHLESYTRFGIDQDARTSTWAVFDRLRSYARRTRLAQAAATNLARDYEAAWRRL